MPLERCTEAACFGCGACAAVCPRDAVAMVPGEGGFLYPKVDPARCVRCGLCDKACPIGAEGLTRPPRRAYAAWAEGTTRAQSTSVGSMVTISQRAYPCTASHDITRLLKPLIHRPIAVGDYAWVAAEAFVGMGVTVGEGAVVGARAVVAKDVPAWAVVVGNPARVVGWRRVKE